jgi:uncharacterized membrane protein YphA (DoxX/SURF4 family)
MSHPVTVPTVFDSVDTTYDFVKVFCLLLTAVLATVIWSLIDRRRSTYAKLDQWLRLYLRALLAITMIGFGTYKIVLLQAQPPDLITLMQPYGDLGPGRLFWTFLGSSEGYKIFAGVVETLGGVLLLVPGFATVGAMVSLGALVAVFTEAGFYGAGVKLPVGHLILLASFLILPDAPRLIDLLVLNRRIEPQPRLLLFSRRWMNYSLWALQWAAGLYAAMTMLSAGYKSVRLRNSVSEITPLRGIWKVDEFKWDGEIRPPLLTDSLRWQRLIFDTNPSLASRAIATIQQMDGQFAPAYMAVVGANDSSLSLRTPSTAEMEATRAQLMHTRAGGAGNAELSYKRPSQGVMILDGLMNGHRLEVTLQKEERQFLVQTIQFHWIRENEDISW